MHRQWHGAIRGWRSPAIRGIDRPSPGYYAYWEMLRKIRGMSRRHPRTTMKVYLLHSRQKIRKILVGASLDWRDWQVQKDNSGRPRCSLERRRPNWTRARILDLLWPSRISAIGSQYVR